MFFYNIKHNLIIILCTLLMINGCNDENSKLIIENNDIAEKTNKPFFNKNDLKKEVLKNKITEKNNIKLKEENDNIIFEFRNEKLLQGRNISDNIKVEKTRLALSAVQKMFKKNLSSSDNEINLKNNDNISTLDRYNLEKSKSISYRHTLFLVNNLTLYFA